jgi:hypothetical protein
MNSMVFELASVNFITICLIVFGAVGLLRVAKNRPEARGRAISAEGQERGHST